ncbi:MAG: bifunctional 5,10-methylenetetrahydrofolate dehydrogenase/5,10-methenyltetrahydrofolate cyclohydrolase, partial [Gammaproteobacteria bacterium]
MSAKIIDGRAAADAVLDDCAARIAAQKKAPPGLAVILAGENPASQVYVRNKVRACERVKLRSQEHILPADVGEDELLDKIAALNADSAVHGILVQLPLPAHIDSKKALLAVAPEKDVDGFHPQNLGKLTAGLPSLWPCTPHGCMHLLHREGISLAGKRAVVLGRSNIVGKPMALMLINAGATVTVCNSKTPDLAETAARA